MHRWTVRLLAVAIAFAAIVAATPATAKLVGISASPNPARLGERVRHDVEVGTAARLDVWTSARGFERPGLGSLPPGVWSYECCPSQTAGTPAWHYRSSIVARGLYRFGARAIASGLYLSTARVGGASAGVWVRIR